MSNPASSSTRTQATPEVAPPLHSLRIAAAGTGHGGATVASALVLRGLASEIALIDAHRERAGREAMHLALVAPFAQPAHGRASVRRNPAGLQLVATPAVAVPACAAWRLSMPPSGSVIGSRRILETARFRTLLETARFRTLLGWHAEVDPRNVHARIFGAHGHGESAACSTAAVACTPLRACRATRASSCWGVALRERTAQRRALDADVAVAPSAREGER